MIPETTVGRGWRTWALPGCVFVLVSAGFGLGWLVSERSESDLVRAETELSSEHIAIRIEDYLRVRIDLVMHLRDQWLEEDNGGIEAFDLNATLARQRYPEIDAINWVDSEGIIRHVVPREPNLAALGQDLTRHPVASDVLAGVRESWRPRITPPLDLYQGGRGFAIYVPFFRRGKLEGFINAAFRVAPLIEDCLQRGVREHYYFSLRDGDEPVYAYAGDFEPGQRFAASREVAVGDRKWTLRVHPTPQQLRHSSSLNDEVVPLFGLLTAGLLAFATRRILVSRRLLASSRERLRRVVEDTPAMICRYRPDATLTFVNQAFAERSRKPAAELIGSSLLATMPEEQRQQYISRTASRDREQSLLIHVERFETADGVRWEEWRDRALVDEAGVVCEFQAIGIDVTESFVAREALSDSEERFRAIFRSVSDGILILSETGEILESNHRASELFRTPLDGPATANAFDLGADREELARAIRDAWTADLVPPESGTGAPPRGKDTALVQWQAVDRCGRTFWAEANLTAAELGGLRRLVAVVRDVTERKRLEYQVRHGQKMEAVGTLAGGVAHDFNNVLTAIMGHAELVRLHTPLGSPAWASLEGIAEACERAAGVTRSLLTFCRKENVEKRRAELNRVVAETVRMLRPMLPAAIDVAIDLPSVEVWVEADRTQMQQVLMNLALNARDAMPDGGELRITLSTTDPDSMRSGCAILCVSDTGIGMTEAVRERVAEPFFTTKTREQGTGLGMAVVHGILVEHGGQMVIESQPGRGTRVEIQLPLSAPDPVVATAPGETPHAFVEGQRVLLVEDDKQVRDILAIALRRAGYDVVEAADGVVGLGVMIHPGSRVDLMVLDIDLPRLSGTAVLERVRAAGRYTPVILISGNPSPGLGDALPENVIFLQKPFTLPALTTVVARMLAQAPVTR